MKAHETGVLSKLMASSSQSSQVVYDDNYDFDLIVIGGGSGGLAASKVTFSLICSSLILTGNPLKLVSG